MKILNAKRPALSEEKTSDESEVIVSKKRKTHDNNLHKPPTGEELVELREIANLHHSNLFRLKIEELLRQVKLKEKYSKQFSTWFSNFRQCIESIAETAEEKLEQSQALKTLEIPLQIDVSPDPKVTFKFLKPSNISTVGSYALGTTLGSNVIIDVMVEMPSTLFHKHDYQNYRYHRKRAAYLAYMASHITDDLADKKTFIGEAWTPLLKIIPAGSLGKHVTVHLHIVAQQSTFKSVKFMPEKSNIRSGWYLGNSSETAIPTPLYNATILRDLMMAQVNTDNSDIIAQYPSIRDGIILLKIWLYQRQTQSTRDCNGHLMTMYVLHLLQEKKLNALMSSYQIVRNVWNCLAHSNWTGAGITMCQSAEAKARISIYHQYYDCVFLDVSGNLNLAAKLSANNYSWLRSEAELAIKCLDTTTIDSFQALFMRRLPFHTTFDNFICLHDAEALERLARDQVADKEKLDLGVDKRAKVIKLLVTTLQKGLGQRVSAIYVLPSKQHEWEITETCPTTIQSISIGFHLNPDFCYNIIEKGPPANLPEATEFREFWEDKSDLRRFQDGAICEAVVWARGKTIAEKRSLTKKIVMWLLKGKFNISKDQYSYVGDELDQFLRMKKTIVNNFSYGTGEEATLRVLKAFADLEKQLTSLNDIPLAVTGVQGSSAVFRYTDVFPPLATVYGAEETSTTEAPDCLVLAPSLTKAPKYAPAIVASVQLSSSGKWPDELEAVRKTKAAFYIQIAQCLRKQYQLKTKVRSESVDVLKDGFIFRLQIAQQKEIALLKQQIGDDGIIRYRDNDEATELECRLFHLPKLTSALHGLHSQQPSFGAACCLMKRWLSAQLIDNSHMPDIVVELLLAAQYLAPSPYKPAQTPQVAFLRFLEFFARNSWTTEPTIVNFNDEITQEDIIEVENVFGTMRDTLPPLVISTPYDPKTCYWTRQAPTQLILTRVSLLAKETIKIIEGNLTSSILDWASIFRPPMAAYDCLIYLKPDLNPRRIQFHDLDAGFLAANWQPYSKDKPEKMPVVEFNPVENYLAELRNGYGEFALFFHDTYGGNVIGVVMIPSALEPKDFKITNMNCRLIKNGKLVLNLAAMIEDFSNLGDGLIEKIDLQSRKFF